MNINSENTRTQAHVDQKVIYLFKHRELQDSSQVTRLLEEERWARKCRFGELPLIGPNRLPTEFLRAAA